MAIIEIWTDGACSGNPGAGGWGALLRCGKDEKELSGREDETTNNRMELTAAIKGLEALKVRSEVKLYTDSQYVQKGMTEWVFGWKKKNWKTADNKPVKNEDLWQKLYELTLNHKVEFIWVRGHNGLEENERVDRLAVNAIHGDVSTHTNNSKSYTSLKELQELGLINENISEIERVIEEYPILISESMFNKIDVKDEKDPIRLQFVPDAKELIVKEDELDDPIGDAHDSPVIGVVHRYPDRVLLKVTSACKVNCRYCFRRGRFFDQTNSGGFLTSEQDIDNAINYIQERKEVSEVLLSGGDPLTLSDKKLKAIIDKICDIEHVKILRINTRVPVTDAKRVTSELIKVLKCGKTVYIMLHCNHPKELGEEERLACARIADAGIPILSQSVLLKGVNDNYEILSELMKTFAENRIIPHYLHHLDKAKGISHFRVPIEIGQKLVKSLRGNISGICQPRYIIDIPRGFGKCPLESAFIQEQNIEELIIEDWKGKKHKYKA